MMILDQTGLALLIAITLVLTIAMLIGWFNFGRVRYALLWAMAAGGEVLQWVISALTLGQTGVVARIVVFTTGALTVVDATLIVLGFFNRHGRPPPLVPILLLAALTLAVIGYGALIVTPPSLTIRGWSSNLFAAVMFTLSALVVRPAARKAGLADFAAVGAVLLFAAYEYGISAIWFGLGGGTQPAGLLAPGVMIIGLPVAYVAAGIAAMLVIASDLHDRLQSFVTRDQVTGALNRRGLEQAMAPALANARRRKQPLSLVVIDVGDATGVRVEAESLLAAVADAANAVIREEDLFGHLGDGEFCVVLIDSNSAAAAIVTQRMRRAFEALDDLPGCQLQPIFGVTDMRDDDAAIGPMIRRAREMMIEARLSASAAKPLGLGSDGSA